MKKLVKSIASPLTRIFTRVPKPNKQKYAKKQRSARISLLPLHHISLRLLEPASEQTHFLSNVSTSGLGIVRKTMNIALKANQTVRAELRFGSTGLPITMKVIHVSDAVVGCEFQGDLTEVQKRVNEYFDLEFGALNLLQVNPEMLQEDPDGQPHLLHGDNGCELYLISQGSKIIRFNLTFFGNHIEGGNGKPTRFGQVIEDGPLEKVRYKGSNLIRWNSEKKSNLIASATRFINGIKFLTSEQKEGLIQLIQM